MKNRLKIELSILIILIILIGGYQIFNSIKEPPIDKKFCQSIRIESGITYNEADDVGKQKEKCLKALENTDYSSSNCTLSDYYVGGCFETVVCGLFCNFICCDEDKRPVDKIIMKIEEVREGEILNRKVCFEDNSCVLALDFIKQNLNKQIKIRGTLLSNYEKDYTFHISGFSFFPTIYYNFDDLKSLVGKEITVIAKVDLMPRDSYTVKKWLEESRLSIKIEEIQ